MDAVLVPMLQRQEAQRFAPETLRRMEVRTAAGEEWIDVVEDLQREVAIEFGFTSALGIATAVHAMRTAHVRRPELAALSVYARCNLAEEGALAAGGACPDVPLFTLAGERRELRRWLGPTTVVAAGSWT